MDNSKENAQKECNEHLKKYFQNNGLNDNEVDENKICQLIEKLETKIEIISPWT
ncbi:hypothetical protein [Cyanothece sp. BG0011]|uniref:hypothetical protein n=1 Tax=Cyanothece sp. BG0011 TaxID=2082950 RepID=UPI0013008DE9|nr:hypothetical protein [Cyanothece sp. BG0011]